MLNLGDIEKSVRTGLKKHSSLILSVAAGVGTLTTTYLASKASFQAADLIKQQDALEYPPYDKSKRLKERTKLVWKLYIPTAISATSTIVCIVGANRVGVKKTLAAQTALAVSQRAFSEYRDKVIEELGAHKDQSIRDKLAEDRVKREAPPSQDILVTGPGNVLCCEMFTGRYFASDMETLRKAQNNLNAKLLHHDYATLDDFYYMIGLNPTSWSGETGWKSSKLMNLEFSTVLTDDGRPCLAFNYNYTTSF